MAKKKIVKEKIAKLELTQSQCEDLIYALKKSIIQQTDCSYPCVILIKESLDFIDRLQDLNSEFYE